MTALVVATLYVTFLIGYPVAVALTERAQKKPRKPRRFFVLWRGPLGMFTPWLSFWVGRAPYTMERPWTVMVGIGDSKASAGELRHKAGVEISWGIIWRTVVANPIWARPEYLGGRIYHSEDWTGRRGDDHWQYRYVVRRGLKVWSWRT